MFNDNQFSSVKSNIQSIYVEDEIDKKLQLCLGICEMMFTVQMDADTERIVRKMSNYSQKLLNDTQFRKAIWKRTAIIKTESITYFGDDLQKGDMYDYDETLEKDIVKIDFEITNFIATIQAFIMKNDSIM